MFFPAVTPEPRCGDRIRRYRIIVVTSLMKAVGLIAGGFLRYNMGGFSGEKCENLTEILGCDGQKSHFLRENRGFYGGIKFFV